MSCFSSDFPVTAKTQAKSSSWIHIQIVNKIKMISQHMGIAHRIEHIFPNTRFNMLQEQTWQCYLRKLWPLKALDYNVLIIHM